jgi:CheY-like chemotaxis protein/HPt (histidine-containing phosphotransfer) domain-containing protein
LSGTADSWQQRTQPIVTRHQVRALKVDSGRRILLAEDNPVNQKVARNMIERLGLAVEVVSNGREAIAAWGTGGFDLIFMDCQMPQLDGYAATREIRRLEPEGQRIPIVALTAHAMKGDEDKCRAAGMDDYLTKPLDRAKLLAALERLLGKATLQQAAPIADPAPAKPEPVDWTALLDSAGGDSRAAAELVELFISSGDDNLAAIAAALARGDYAAVGEQAHALKGAGASVHARAASAAAAALEQAVRSGANDRVPHLNDALRDEMCRVRDSVPGRETAKTR